MTQVYLSLGSNIKRECNIRSAIDQLRTLYGPLTLSSVYQSQAVGFEGSDFYNLVVGFETKLSLSEVHRGLRSIEEAHGRERSVDKYRSRSLDIDLLLFGDVVQQGACNIPRDEIKQYAFVLLPLSEIAGDIVHPETNQTIAEIWSDFDAGDQPIRKIDFKF